MAKRLRKYILLIKCAQIWSRGHISSLQNSVEELDTSANGYYYKSLDINRNEIRLLKIRHLDGGNGLINCTLGHVSLDSDPEYDALSYTWGNTSTSGQISGALFIDGNKVAVTHNLLQAVRGIFLAEPGKALWVDALCINQRSKEERSNQVSKMKRIYQGAACVHTWLGAEYEDSNVALKTLRSIFDIGLRKTFYDGDWHPATELGPIATERISSLVSFFSRPYWERAWVVQEVAFARHLVFHCGSELIEWTEMESALRSIRSDGNFLMTAFRNSGIAPSLTILLSGGPVKLINCFGEIEDADKATQTTPLGHLLILHRYRMATNPRDKILSMLGLTTVEIQKKIPINYQLSVAQVFLNAITAIIEEENDLTIISENKKPRDFDPSLPSWVPRFTYQKGEHLGRISHLGAGLDNPPPWTGAGSSALLTTNITSRVLKLRGIAVGRITSLGPAMPEPATAVSDFELVFGILYEWWTIYFSTGGKEIVEGKNSFINIIKCNDWYRPLHLANKTPILKGLVTHEEREKRWKEQLNVVKTSAVKSLNVVMSVYRLDDVTPLLGPEMEGIDPMMVSYAERIVSLVTLTSTNRRFMVAGKHYGLAPFCAEVGDVVVVVLGSPVPIVLRESAPSMGGGYLNIGDAYLNGIMDEEAVMDLERGIGIVEEFVIH
ncbi:hypothetical protein EG329_003217 [Mollisiaceae sp. DMI_Dod_QoI]|nr:hypothetical protein EG329_003217 [Helotiales sp. DMI_Dod_QoI]